MAPLELLRELVRIRSVNPPGDEDAVAAVLGDYLVDAGLHTQGLRSPGGRVSLVARLDGPPDRSALVCVFRDEPPGALAAGRPLVGSDRDQRRA